MRNFGIRLKHIKMRTLIVFGTRKGTTEKTAQVIAETIILKLGHQVEIHNIRKKRRFRHRLHEFDNIIIGSSIVSGRWKSCVLRLLKSRDLESRKVAVFVTAGGTMNKTVKYGLTKKEARDEAVRNYIDKYLDRFHFTPVAKTAFGGLVIRRGVEKYNSWSREDIESWAISLGTLFEEN